jgi:hypothetical protein
LSFAVLPASLPEIFGHLPIVNPFSLVMGLEIRDWRLGRRISRGFSSINIGENPSKSFLSS